MVRIIRNSKIKGFAENNNIGIKESQGIVVGVINPDIEILNKSIDQLYDFLVTNPDIGIVGPKLLNVDQSIQESVRKFINFRILLFRIIYWGKTIRSNPALSNYLMLDYDKDKPMKVDWVIGAAMFISRRAINQVGLFDEKYFLYIEDQDWCFRMWQKGWKVYYNPDSVMIHNHQRDSVKKISRKTLYHAYSLFYFLVKFKRF